MKHSRWTYVKHALLHPWHVVVLAGATVFGVANWSLLILITVFLFAEIILLWIIMNLKVFRNYVDNLLLAAERSKAAEYRAKILFQLAQEHQRAYIMLESRIDAMESRFERYPAIGSYIAHECKEMLGSYLKLGLQYQMLTGQDMADIQAISVQLDTLKKIQVVKPDPINEHRISVAEKRLAVLHESVSARANLLNQMEAISETICLKTEQAALPSESILKLRVDDSDPEQRELAYIEDIDMERMNLARPR